MRAAWSTILLLLILGCHERADSSSEPTITNYEAEGSLASLEPIKCVGLSEVKNTNTPADIFPAVRLCVDAGDFERASDLYALAGVYGRFDTLRVEDESAHQAILVLQINSLETLPQDRAQAFRDHLKANLDPKSSRLQKLCAKIEMIGPPSYEPIYMIQHGMGAFIESEENQEIETNAAAAWTESLDGYLHCPKSRA